MLYLFRLLDRPDGGELRQRVRPEHKAYLAQVAHRIAFAGPLTHDDGQTMIGSVLAIEHTMRAMAGFAKLLASKHLPDPRPGAKAL